MTHLVQTIDHIAPVLAKASESGIAYRDLRAILAWVRSKEISLHTQRAFLIEAQRWLAWLIWSKFLSELSQHETWLDKADATDAATYENYLACIVPAYKREAADSNIVAPESEDFSLSPSQIEFPLFVLNAAGMDSQPFKALPLKTSSRARAISVLKTMYNDMMDMHVADGVCVAKNPFRKCNVKADNVIVSRFKGLTDVELDYVDRAIIGMQEAGDIHYHQCRWIWNALLWSALRRSELASGRVCDMYVEADEAGVKTWTLRIAGIGDASDTIPLCEKFMGEFHIYREYHGFPEFQGCDNEDTPLVLPLRGNIREESKAPLEQIIYREIKRVMNLGADIALAQGNINAVGRLRGFASYSARHTCITRIVDFTDDITIGQDMGRHVSVVTTSGYRIRSVAKLADALKRLGEEK